MLQLTYRTFAVQFVLLIKNKFYFVDSHYQHINQLHITFHTTAWIPSHYSQPFSQPTSQQQEHPRDKIVGSPTSSFDPNATVMPANDSDKLFHRGTHKSIEQFYHSPRVHWQSMGWNGIVLTWKRRRNYRINIDTAIQFEDIAQLPLRSASDPRPLIRIIQF